MNEFLINCLHLELPVLMCFSLEGHLVLYIIGFTIVLPIVWTGTDHRLCGAAYCLLEAM